MTDRLRKDRRTSGSATVEFAIIAPVLIMAVLSTADIGFAIHESLEVDQTLRNGAETALSDPGESRVGAVLAAVDATGIGQSTTAWTVRRYCACSESGGAETSCSTTCAGDRPTAILYDITGVRPYAGIFLPARDLTRSATLRVR